MVESLEKKAIAEERKFNRLIILTMCIAAIGGVTAGNLVKPHVVRAVNYISGHSDSTYIETVQSVNPDSLPYSR